MSEGERPPFLERLANKRVRRVERTQDGGLMPIDRRQFMRLASLSGIVAALAACGAPTEAIPIPATATPFVPTGEPANTDVPTDAPLPAPTDAATATAPATPEVRSFQPIEITRQLIAMGLTGIGGEEGFSDPTVQIPIPTVTPELGVGGEVSAQDSIAQANSYWYLRGEDEQITFDESLPNNPIKGLRYVLALANSAGIQNQPVSFRDSLPGLQDAQENHLAIPRVALNISEPILIEGALPPGFVLKQNSNMLVVGQYGDQVMVAIEENAGRTASSPQTPRLFMVSLPRAQFEQLVSQSGAEIDGNQIRFNQDTTAPINNIEEGLAAELESQSAAYFADTNSEGVLYENPLVPFPEEDIEYKEVIAQEGKVVAVNEEGSEIATAVYEEEDNMWEWNVEFTNSKEYQSGIDHYLKVMDLKIDDVVIAQETIFIADQAYQVITAEPDPAKLSQECEKYKMAYKKVPLFIGVTSDTTEWASISRSLNILNQGLDRNIGSQIVYYKLDDPAYTDLARTTFNQYLVSGELNEPTLWAEPDPNNLSQDSYSYSRADEVARFAEKEGAAFMATHLIDSKREDYLPKWLREGSYTRDQYIEILKGHVRGAIHHFSEEFPDLPVRYSVVNEPFDWNKLAGFWHEKIGPEFIEIAYKAAREANPQAQLYFNDVNVFWEGGIDDHDRAVYNQVKSLKDKGLIDGVGLQMHLDATKLPNVSVVRDLIKMYQDIGVKVYITEFDVDISGLQMSSPVTEQLHKAQVFAEMLQVFLDSSAVDSVTYFGFSPSVSWKPQSDAHMFDNRLNPQAAFYSIASTIYQQIQ